MRTIAISLTGSLVYIWFICVYSKSKVSQRETISPPSKSTTPPPPIPPTPLHHSPTRKATPPSQISLYPTKNTILFKQSISYKTLPHPPLPLSVHNNSLSYQHTHCQHTLLPSLSTSLSNAAESYICIRENQGKTPQQKLCCTTYRKRATLT